MARGADKGAAKNMARDASKGASRGADKNKSRENWAKKLKVWQLLLGLLLVIGGTTLFIVGVSGGFGKPKAEIDVEYYCSDNCEPRYMDLTPSEYEKLVADKKSFVVLIDQGGCKTADKLKEFMSEYASSEGFRVYKIIFEDVKKTSLYDFVKYYPSVAVASKGKVIGFLRADADEDADAYNQYKAFETWIQKYLK